MTRDSWSSDDGKVFISGTYFSSVTGSDFTADVTEISVGGGTRDVDQVRCFGSGTNSYMYRKGQELKEANIKFHKATMGPMLAIEGGSFISGLGLFESGITGDGLKFPVRVIYDFMDRFDVSGAHFRAIFDDAEATDYKWSMSNDGTMESEMTLKCLPHKYKEAYTANRVLRPVRI